jgi:hypothetical protein
MRRVIATLVFVLLAASALQADTLYLRNGSVLQGVFLGFENGQFTFQITSGDGRGTDRILRFPARDVLRLVIDRQTGERPESGPRPGTYPPSGGFESFPEFEVRLVDQWMRSEIRVARGQRVRVEASGQVYLDGRTPSSPDGINRRDPDAPLPDDPDGALIAAIGQDQDSPAFLIGRSREFTADRDGILYFTVNHWETRNARGSYTVRVAVERRGAAGGAGGATAGRRERTFTVYGNRPWTDTGIEVEPGMNFEIVASGAIEISRNLRVDAMGDRGSRTSNFPLPEAGAGALIAKIRYRQGSDSNILAVGTRNTLTAEPGEYGRLILGINDNYFNDNGGSFTVTIRW